MIKWAFELSEEIQNLVMVRSVTRLSHASGNVVFDQPSGHRFKDMRILNAMGLLLDPHARPGFQFSGGAQTHPAAGKASSRPSLNSKNHPFNTYSGPQDP